MSPEKKKAVFGSMISFVLGLTIAGSIGRYEMNKQNNQSHEIVKDSVAALNSCVDSLMQTEKDDEEIHAIVQVYLDTKDQNEKMKVADSLVDKLRN